MVYSYMAIDCRIKLIYCWKWR